MRTFPKTLLAIAAAVTVLAGCKTTTYHQRDGAGTDPAAGSSFGREVFWHLADSFYVDPPDCAVVMPAAKAPSAALARLIEESAFRYLHDRLDRVIGPRSRRAAERDLAVDLEHPGDRRLFSTRARCRHFVRPRIGRAGDFYAIVWSERSLALGLEMTDVEGQVIWSAAHAARRGDGGLPTSPLGLGSAAVVAGLERADQDVLPSLVDDTLRRIIVTLPDTRDFSNVVRRTR